MDYVLGRLESLVAQGTTTDHIARRVESLWDCVRHTPNVMPGDEPFSVVLVWNRSGWHVEMEIESHGVEMWAVRP
ncbi:hypothetical protein UFOVP314_25 [uncultured Caudovirales phage]|uniref:Uncharacterized protein n=1 Tax=uncultured Caudovirales phage TaxID=2100421 RepID=A0A6J5LV40_9CAUD|nr:hypothetical protein UFOVP314_25 [uncultured Caudovirales phage]